MRNAYFYRCSLLNGSLLFSVLAFTCSDYLTTAIGLRRTDLLLPALFLSFLIVTISVTTISFKTTFSQSKLCFLSWKFILCLLSLLFLSSALCSLRLFISYIYFPSQSVHQLSTALCKTDTITSYHCYLRWPVCSLLLAITTLSGVITTYSMDSRAEIICMHQ